MRFKQFWENTKRVFLVAKKPTWHEYWAIVKITGLGILFLGVVGFIVMLLVRLFYAPF